MSLLPLDNLQVKLKGTWFLEKDAAADFFKFHIGIFKNVYFLLCKQTEKRWQSAHHQNNLHKVNLGVNC